MSEIKHCASPASRPDLPGFLPPRWMRWTARLLIVTLAWHPSLSVAQGSVAAGDIALLAAHDEEHSLYSREREGLFGDTTKHDETHALRGRGNTLSAGGTIVLDSGGDQRHQGSRLVAPEVTLISGGDLHFDAVKDTRSETHIDSDNNGLWQRYEGEGWTHERVRQSQILTEHFSASAQGKIIVELPRISADSEYLATDIGLARAASLSERFALMKQRNDALRQDDPASVVAVMAQIDPGLGWLTQLNQDNIDWQRVDELHSGWDESSSGLGTVGAIIVAVVVAIVTYGAASAVIGSAASAGTGGTVVSGSVTTVGAGTTASATVGTTSAWAGATTVGTATTIGSTTYAAGTAFAAGWANVAVSSGIAGTVSSAAVQAGTTGKVDWNLALKSGLIATLTAGLTNYGFEALDGQSLNQIAGLAPSAGASSGASATVGWNFNTPEQLAALVGRGVINAGIESAINRTEFKDAFVQSLVSDAAALTARDIGAKWGSGADRNPVMQTVAHAGLGATAALATGKDPAAGAIGGAVESVIDNTVRVSGLKVSHDNHLYIVGTMLVGGMLAEALGHDGVVAAQAAQNAAINNRSFNAAEAERLKALYGDGDEESLKRVTAAMCARTKCYAEFPEGSPKYIEMRDRAAWGETLPEYYDDELLAGGLFRYTGTDAHLDWVKRQNNTYGIGNRALGLVQGVGGVAEIVGGVAASPSCVTVAACAAVTLLMVNGVDNAWTGFDQLFSGKPEDTLLNQALQSAGLSPEMAAWVEFAFGMGNAVAASNVLARGVNATTQVPKVVVDDVVPPISTGAESAANAAKLKVQLTAEEIAGGHAFEKHVLNQGEFAGLGIRTREQFAKHIQDVINNPTASRQLSSGRTAYWQESTSTVVIRNPRAADGGTAFQPTNGRAYFDNLR